MDIYRGKFLDLAVYIMSKLGNGEPIPCDDTMAICQENKLICGVIYSYQYSLCYVTLYAENPAWATKTNLSEIFRSPFLKEGIKAVKCLTDVSNDRVNKLLKGLDFTHEATLRYARANGNDELVWSITEEELTNKRWYK